jgi:hypothetical protein
MVNTSTAVLPAPPATSAQVEKIMKPPVCSRPTTAMRQGDAMRMGRPVTTSVRSKAALPPAERRKATSKGPA